MCPLKSKQVQGTIPWLIFKIYMLTKSSIVELSKICSLRLYKMDTSTLCSTFEAIWSWLLLTKNSKRLQSFCPTTDPGIYNCMCKMLWRPHYNSNCLSQLMLVPPHFSSPPFYLLSTITNLGFW